MQSNFSNFFDTAVYLFENFSTVRKSEFYNGFNFSVFVIVEPMVEFVENFGQVLQVTL